MIFGSGKNFKLQYSLSSVWTDFHTQASPITVNYSKCKHIVQNVSTIIQNGASVRENVSFGRTNKKFRIDYVVKHYDEDIVGGTVDGVTVKGIDYFHTVVVPNGDKNYIRIYPDLDNAPSKYYDVNILSLEKFNFDEVTYSLYRLDLEARELTSTLI